MPLRLKEQAFDAEGIIDLTSSAGATILGTVRPLVGSGITRYVDGQSYTVQGTGKPLKGAKMRWKVYAMSEIVSDGTVTCQILTGDTEDTCTQVLQSTGPITAANIKQGDLLADGIVDHEAKKYIRQAIVLSAAVTSGKVYGEVSHFGN